ncbi:glycosyl hydrolase family 92-domain-containing protein [Mycena olivaceomarginata]|nr:glycosyl hydrolase family 92-domain-containing protein [Mycena olivaceomarginata]
MSQGQPQLRGRSSLPMLTAHHLFQSETEASADDKMLKPSSNEYTRRTCSPPRSRSSGTRSNRTYNAPVNVTGDNSLLGAERGEGEEYWDSFLLYLVRPLFPSLPFYGDTSVLLVRVFSSLTPGICICFADAPFRVVHPLYAITAPTAQSSIVRALSGIYKHTGWLPDCRMSGDKGFTQAHFGGSNADSLLSDSFAKGVGFAGGVDWTTGLEAMLKDATVMGDFEVEGRGPWGSDTRSASRLLEYAYNVAFRLSPPSLRPTFPGRSK